MPIVHSHSSFRNGGLKRGRGGNFLDRMWKNMGATFKKFMSETLAPLGGTLLQKGALAGASKLGLPKDSVDSLIKGAINPETVKGLTDTITDQIDSTFKKRKVARKKKKELKKNEELYDVGEEFDDDFDIPEPPPPPGKSSKAKKTPPPPDDDPPKMSKQQQDLIAARKRILGYGLTPKKKSLLDRLVNESPLMKGKGLRVLK